VRLARNGSSSVGLALIFRMWAPCADREIALREHLGHQPPEVFEIVAAFY